MSKEGWGKPTLSKKFHYFVDGRSLCWKWGFMPDEVLEPDNGSPIQKDDCVQCYKKFLRRKGVNALPETIKLTLDELTAKIEAGEIKVGDVIEVVEKTE